MKKMKYVGWMALVVLLGGLLAYSQYAPVDALKPEVDAVVANKAATSDKTPAPDFALPDEEGKIYRLSDYRGQPVIVNFWATWCPPCRAELPSMNRAWQQLKDEGVAMVALNVGEDEHAVFAFTADYPIDFTILLDEPGEMMAKFEVAGLPTTIVIDPEGNIAFTEVGERAWDDPVLLNRVRALRLAGG